MSEHDGDNLPNSVQNNNINDSLRAKFQNYKHANLNFHGNTNLITAEEAKIPQFFYDFSD